MAYIDRLNQQIEDATKRIQTIDTWLTTMMSNRSAIVLYDFKEAEGTAYTEDPFFDDLMRGLEHRKNYWEQCVAETTHRLETHSILLSTGKVDEEGHWVKK